MILLIDNYDSFTYNLYQALAMLGSEVVVARNDQITIEEIEKMNVKGIVLSPGPGAPLDAGICVELIRRLGSKKPIFGVCLGHQAIGAAYGAKVERAEDILHGKESLIFHRRGPLFKNVSLPFKAGRYHSLIVSDLPSNLAVEAEDSAGNIMAISHKTYPVYGVQFHPESILTPEGKHILQSFLELCSANERRAHIC